jgi:hypothetical protein
MIFANPFSERIAIEFFDELDSTGGEVFSAFSRVVDRHLDSQQKEDFGTPNFGRVSRFAADPSVRIHLDPDTIRNIRHTLNSDGRGWLNRSITEIQPPKSTI